MSVWLLKITRDKDLPEDMSQCDHLPLPFDGLPDLSSLNSKGKAMKMLRDIYPNDPPETRDRRLELFWEQFYNMLKEDVIAVMMEGQIDLLIYQVSGAYRYDETMQRPHRIAVEWQCDVPMRVFHKHKQMFISDHPLHEITDKDYRVAILEKLPRPYNRFRKLRWLTYIMVGMALFRVAMRAQ